jgi:hypothetical protein
MGPEYWLATCQHATCGWQAVMGSEEDAEVAKVGHEGDHPDHPVEVLTSDQVQRQYLASLRPRTGASPRTDVRASG